LTLLEILLINETLESLVVESRICPLLGDSHVAKNSLDDVKIEGQAAALDRVGGHEIKHSAGVQITLVDAKGLDCDVGKFGVDTLQESAWSNEVEGKEEIP